MADRKLRILALGAHPDDMEWHCGGTLARYAAEGHEVFICHASSGNKGSFKYTSDELAKVRRQEAIDAAAVIGATSLTADIADGEVAVTVENEFLLTECVRRARPDVVITVDPNDYHGDHRAVGNMAQHATFMATCPLYKTESPPTDAVPSLYFCDTLAGMNFEPTEWVDIGDVLETKVRMMMAHTSQLEWIGERGDGDLAEGVAEEFKAVARFRGMQCGVRYAEAFRLCPMAMRPRPYRVLP